MWHVAAVYAYHRYKAVHLTERAIYKKCNAVLSCHTYFEL